MPAAFVADLVLILHLLFVLFVVFGGLIAASRPWVAWVHIPMVLWASVINGVGWICPLTPLENRLRAAAGEAGYTGGFVEHYLTPVIYPTGLTYEAGVALGALALGWNVLIYAMVVRRRPR